MPEKYGSACGPLHSQPTLLSPPSPSPHSSSKTLSPSTPFSLRGQATQNITVTLQDSTIRTFTFLALPLSQPPRTARPSAVDLFPREKETIISEERSRWTQDIVLWVSAMAEAHDPQKPLARLDGEVVYRGFAGRKRTLDGNEGIDRDKAQRLSDRMGRLNVTGGSHYRDTVHRQSVRGKKETAKTERRRPRSFTEEELDNYTGISVFDEPNGSNDSPGHDWDWDAEKGWTVVGSDIHQDDNRRCELEEAGSNATNHEDRHHGINHRAVKQKDLRDINHEDHRSFNQAYHRNTNRGDHYRGTNREGCRRETNKELHRYSTSKSREDYQAGHNLITNQERTDSILKAGPHPREDHHRRIKRENMYSSNQGRHLNTNQKKVDNTFTSGLYNKNHSALHHTNQEVPSQKKADSGLEASHQPHEGCRRRIKQENTDSVSQAHNSSVNKKGADSIHNVRVDLEYYCSSDTQNCAIKNEDTPASTSTQSIETSRIPTLITSPISRRRTESQNYYPPQRRSCSANSDIDHQPCPRDGMPNACTPRPWE